MRVNRALWAVVIPIAVADAPPARAGLAIFSPTCSQSGGTPSLIAFPSTETSWPLVASHDLIAIGLPNATVTSPSGSATTSCGNIYGTLTPDPNYAGIGAWTGVTLHYLDHLAGLSVNHGTMVPAAVTISPGMRFTALPIDLNGPCAETDVAGAYHYYWKACLFAAP